MISSLTAEKLACVRGDKALFEGLSIPRARRPGAGGGRRQWRGQDLAAAPDRGLPVAGRGRVSLVKTATRESDDAEERGQLVGWLGHQDGLKPQLTVREQLSFFARLYGRERRSAPALERVGLARQRDLPCRYLSAGQRRRLALARLLISQPPALAAGRAVRRPGQRRAGAGGAI